MDWKVRAARQFLWLSIILLAIRYGAAEQRIVCYYTNWSVYRPGTAKFSPQNINPYLCTHLIYAFGGFTKDNALKPFDKYQDIEKGGYAKFNGLKTYNKNLKTMLAIGGWNEGSSRFSPMVADPKRRREFVKNAVKFLRQNHFDGLDLDWEYPAFRDGGKARDKENYANLVQELREEFERESSKTGRARLLLSMAIPAGIEYIDKGYDIPRLNEYLDFFNLLSYDYHSAFEPAVNHHSPLYPLEEESEYNYDGELTIDFSINHLFKKGAASDKIVLGIPTYGRSYTLYNEDATEIGSPADGPGEEGDATREKGYLAYYEICESVMNSDDWEVVQPNPNAMGPYAYKGNQWVGYDDEEIVRQKARYVNEKNLGGIMFWSIDNDDFRGKCHNRPYPLIEAAKETLLSGNKKTQNAQKGKTTDGTKKIRTQGVQGNLVGRKVSSGEGRRTTTLAPVSRNRLPVTKPRNKPETRLDSNEKEIQSVDPLVANEDEDDSRFASNAVRSLESADNKPKKNKPRGKNRRRPESQGGRNRLRDQNAEKASQESDSEVSSSNKLTTPEPPTTPDPGSDFKCEDEGFFSHPRDCKKYFWCLDSGPGGLGIVAHQFTCPSGLVFNKAADSCDYPRNVICPKSRTSSGSVVSTTRAPITAATSRTTYLHSTTQRTTTSTSDSVEDEEYYEEDEDEDEEEEEESVSTTTARALLYKTINRARPTTTSRTTPITTTINSISTTKSYQPLPERSRTTQSQNINEDDPEEDPRVIKELIDLIKKAGGIEQLEKQLLIQEKNIKSGTTSSNGNVTPATISRSLYERVLNRQSTKGVNKLFGSPSTISTFSTTTPSIAVKDDEETESRSRTNFRNGPGRSQFEGLDDLPEVKSLRRAKKPQYVTIERQRPSTRSPDSEEETEIDVQEEEDSANVASSEEKAISNPPEVTDLPQRVTPSYVNIRRTRPATSKSENDVEEKVEDVSDLRPNFRTRRPITSKTTEDAADDTIRTNFRNRRPTTSRNEPENDNDNDDDVEEDDEGKRKKVEEDQNVRTVAVQEETPTTKSRYISINRFRSTTVSPSESSSSENVPISESTVEIVDKFTATSPITEAVTEEGASESSVFLTTTTPTTTPTTTTTTTTTGTPTTTLISISSSDASTVIIQEPPRESTLLPELSSTTGNPENESSVKLVEESATEILLTTVEVPDTSNQDASSYSPLTKETTAAVSQPRPFGFPRRTRPTVSISVTPATEATTPIVPVTQVRHKVALDSFRLPTLKELVGYRTVDTREYTTSAPTTSIYPYDIDKEPDTTTTPDFEKPERPQDPKDPRENLIEKVSSHDSSSPDHETTTSFVTELYPLATTTMTTTTTLAPPILKNDNSRIRYVKRVDVPVRILDESGNDPLTELILRVPEDKLDSAVLKSILRVEVINPIDQSERENKFRRRSSLPRIPSRTTSTATTVKPVTVRGNRVILPRTEFAKRGFYVTKSLQRNTVSPSGTAKPSSTTEFVTTEIPTTTETTLETLTTANSVSELSTDSLKNSETKTFLTKKMSTVMPETTVENNYSTAPKETFTRIPESSDGFTTPLVTIEFPSSVPTSADGTMKTTYSHDATTLMYTRVTETVTAGTNSTQTVSMIYDSEMKTTENEFTMEENRTTVPISQIETSFLQTTDTKTERNPTTFYQTDPYTIPTEGDTTFFEKIDTKTEKNPTTISLQTDPYTILNEDDRSFLGNVDDNAEEITTIIIKADPYITTPQSDRDLATERTSLFNNIVTTDKITTRSSPELAVIFKEVEEEEQGTSPKKHTTFTTELLPTVISTTTESAQFDIDATIEFVQSSIDTSKEHTESSIGTSKFVQTDTETKSVESIDVTTKEFLQSRNEITKTSVPTSIYTTTESVQLNVEATTGPVQSNVEIAEVYFPSNISATTEFMYSNIDTTESIRHSIDTTTESVLPSIDTTIKSAQATTEVVQESANAANIKSNEIEENKKFSRSGTQNFIRRRVINRTTGKFNEHLLRVNPNGTRRRVIIRNRGRMETSTRTDDVQSSSVASVDTPDRKLKPRRRTVLKRMRLKTSGIAEGNDLPEENAENNGGSVQVQDLEAQYNQKNTDREVNLFKNSAGRRPGTVVRPSTTSRTFTRTSSLPDDVSDAIIHRRKFRPEDGGLKPTTKSTIRVTDRSKQNKDDTLTNDDLEVEKDDQSSRAQEVAVTVTQRPQPSAPTATGRPLFRTALRRRISTTQAPRTISVKTTSAPTTTARPTVVRRRQRPVPYEKIVENLPSRPRQRPIIDYDYYEDEEERVIGKPKLSGKLFITGRGGIRCLDQGNFPHPTSCKKFITCARMVSGQVIGTEYTCADKLSFDPVGGICNWSAGLGCKE